MQRCEATDLIGVVGRVVTSIVAFRNVIGILVVVVGDKVGNCGLVGGKWTVNRRTDGLLVRPTTNTKQARIGGKMGLVRGQHTG